jgi:RNA polymerase sigma-70 factor (ECF subfamily)
LTRRAVFVPGYFRSPGTSPETFYGPGSDEEKRAGYRSASESNGRDRQGVDPVDSAAATPSEILEVKEDRELVLRALGRLKLQDRALLVLREFEGLSYQELSTLFGYRMGTVKSILNRARHRLKDALLTLCPDFSNN